MDVYRGDDVTVDLYRNLPAYDYELIIFRVHSGVISPKPQDEDVESITGTYLFTSESFNRMKYTRERLGGELTPAYVEKGASCYLAWDLSVDLDYVDEATTSLVENLCSKRLPVKEAVDRTMATIGPDPEWGAVLKYYPPQSGNKILKELIQ